jgi:hypothetical protein
VRHSWIAVWSKSVGGDGRLMRRYAHRLSTTKEWLGTTWATRIVLSTGFEALRHEQDSTIGLV